MASMGRVCQRSIQNATRLRKAAYNLRVPLLPSCSLMYRRYYSDSSKKKNVRIGCASGFWGDTAVAAPQLIHGGKLDFLVLDYLSEITMSLMTAAKQKMPNMGYAPDFVQVVVAPFIKAIKEKGVRVVSNAGGVNPLACADALNEVAKKASININVAVVLGDDLMNMKKDVEDLGLVDVDSGQMLPKTVNSMNAYFGAGAISRALDLGADIVVTGRCTDSALVLGPLMHSFQWAPDDFDRLAAGSLAGHLIECGAQVTGGIFTDWHRVPDWHKIGFPIVEVEESGQFMVTKPAKTGGLVSPATASEQLLYEIGDPQNYILPDVVCDFSQVQIKEVEGCSGEAVMVTGAKGKPPTDKYKVCATYLDGYRATAVCPIGGPRAAEKGRRTAEAIIARSRGIFKQLGMEDFSRVHIQTLGSEESYGPHANTNLASREAVLWMSVHHQQKRALEMFAREIAPAGTGMAPGLTGIAGGRPKVSPVLKLFSFLYPKDKLKAQVLLNGQPDSDYTETHPPTSDPTDLVYDPPTVDTTPPPSGGHRYRLEDLAYTRSGDKGNHVNVGVVARDPRYVPYLRRALTPEAVEAYLAHLYEDRTTPLEDRIQRYEVPGINGFNFLLKNALGGGGVTSLRSDPQGKAVGQMLLDMMVEDMPSLADLE